MDDSRFDGLARKLGAQRSRRAALRIAGAGVIAGLAPALARSSVTEAAPFEELACLPGGNRCGGRRRDGKPQPRCSRCCTRYTITQSNGQRRCTCKPDFMDCQWAEQCCSNICRIPCECEVPPDEPVPTTPVCIPVLFGA